MPHRLSDVDADALTATCEECGPTRVRRDRGAEQRGHGLRCVGRTKGDPARAAWRRQNWRLRTKYGITREELDALVLEQEGRCAICEQPMADARIDHDHRTGEVRGLLCHACNIGLGLFGDSPERLQGAAGYVSGLRRARTAGSATT